MAGPWDAFQSSDSQGPWNAFVEAPATATSIPPGTSAPTKITVRPLDATPPVSTSEAFGRGAANALTANFYDELAGLAAAGGRKTADEPMSLNQVLLGAYRRIRSDPEAQRLYDEAVAAEREREKAVEQQAPIASTAGSVLGAVAIPLGGLAGAATLPARMARSAVIGGAMGGAAGLGEGESAGDRLARAAAGAGLGGAVGAAGAPIAEGLIQGGRAIAQPLINSVRGAFNPEREAARRVVTALQRDVANDPAAASRLTPNEFVASAQNGGPATIMDLGGETTRALARSAANTSPEGRQALNATINDRFETQAGRVSDWLRSTFHFPNAAQQQEALRETARSVNQANYGRALREGARPIQVPPHLLTSPDFEAAMTLAERRARSRSASEGVARFQPGVRNLQFWDYTKRALDDAANAATRAGRNDEASYLSGLRDQLVETLDAQVPSYAAARAGAAHFFGARDALEAGQNYVTQNFANDATRRALAQMSPTERQLFQDGFVSRLIEKLNATGDRRNVVNQIADSPAAREKLHIALGPQRAAELEAVLRIEGIMDLARGAVQGNSTTARQLAELGIAGGATAYGTYNFDPTAVAFGALVAGHRHIDQRVAQRVAQMLTSTDPRELANGIRAIARSQTLLGALRRVDHRIASVGGQQAAQVPAVQAAAVGRADENQAQVPGPPAQ